MRPGLLSRHTAVTDYENNETPEVRQANVLNRIPQLVRQYFGFDLMPFHKKVLDMLFSGGMMVINLPTEHGKSTLCNVVFPILSLMNDPNRAHIICCTNIREAKRWLATVERHLTTNEALLRDYPWVAKPTRVQGRAWSKTELTVVGRTDISNANPSLIAIGQGSGDIRGRRGLFIGDDLEGNEAMYESERERLYDWFTLEAMRSYEDIQRVKRPLLAVVGTPFDPDSIYFRLGGDSQFSVYRQPYKYESGRLIWPSKRDKIAALRRRWTTKQFQIAMELSPLGDGDLLSYETIQQHTHALTPQTSDQSPIYVSIDPASGSRHRRADYCGLAVVRIEWGQEPLPQVAVLEAYKVRDEAIEQVKEAARLARRYGRLTKPAPVIVEVNAMQRVYRQLFKHFAPDIPVIGHYTNDRNKHDEQMGLTVLKTLVREGRLKLVSPEGRDHQSEGMRSLVHEIRDLGSSKNDHISCAVWFVLYHTFQQVRNRALPRAAQRTASSYQYDEASGRWLYKPTVASLEAEDRQRRMDVYQRPGGKSMYSVIDLSRFRAKPAG